jgi:hypothetical protein
LGTRGQHANHKTTEAAIVTSSKKNSRKKGQKNGKGKMKDRTLKESVGGERERQEGIVGRNMHLIYNHHHLYCLISSSSSSSSKTKLN